jgi:O-antigen/teichoic acid export membrane protein
VSSDAARRVGRGTAVNWVAWILARALALGTLVLLTRALGAGELGALLAALAAGVLGAALAAGGLPDATARQAAAAESPHTGFGRGDLRRALARFALVLPLVLAAVIAITVEAGDGFSLSQVAAAVTLAVTQGITTIMASVFRARGQAGRFALATNLGSSAGRAVIALLAFVLTWDGGLVLWAFAAVNTGVAAITSREAVRGLPDTATSVPGEGALHLGGVVWSLLGNADVVTVGLLLGAGPAGTYSVSLRVAEFSAQFVVAISLFYMPEATRLMVGGSRDALLAVYRAACRWSAITTLVVAGIGFVTAPELGELIYPDDASTVGTLLRILFAGFAVQGALGVSYSTLVAIGAYRSIRTAAVVSLPLIVVGTVAFTQAWELSGAAWATLIAYTVLNVTWMAQVTAHLGTTPFDGRYRRGLLACAGSWLVVAAADRALEPAGAVVTVLAAGTAGLAAAAALLLAARVLGPTEVALLRRMLRLPGSSGRRRRAAPPASRG